MILEIAGRSPESTIFLRLWNYALGPCAAMARFWRKSASIGTASDCSLFLCLVFCHPFDKGGLAMPRRHVTLILSLFALGAAPLLAQDAPAPQPPDWLAPYGDERARFVGARPFGPARRRFQPPCERHLAAHASDTRSGVQLRRLAADDPGDRAPAARHRRAAGRRSRRTPGRRFLRKLYGRGRNRGARDRAGATLAGADRGGARPRRPPRSVRRPRLRRAGRGRHHARSRRPDPLRRGRRPVGPGHAGPRLLSARGRGL